MSPLATGAAQFAERLYATFCKNKDIVTAELFLNAIMGIELGFFIHHMGLAAAWFSAIATFAESGALDGDESAGFTPQVISMLRAMESQLIARFESDPDATPAFEYHVNLWLYTREPYLARRVMEVSRRVPAALDWLRSSNLWDELATCEEAVN